MTTRTYPVLEPQVATGNVHDGTSVKSCTDCKDIQWQPNGGDRADGSPTADAGPVRISSGSTGVPAVAQNGANYADAATQHCEIGFDGLAERTQCPTQTNVFQ